MRSLPLLTFIVLLGLSICIGGAVTGQIILARARRLRENILVVLLMEQMRWMAVRVYIPVGSIAICSGIALVLLSGTSLTTWWVLLSVALAAITACTSALYSLPEYGRLVRMAEETGVDDAELHKRLWRAVWVNRVELAIVVIALFAVAANVIN